MSTTGYFYSLTHFYRESKRDANDGKYIRAGMGLLLQLSVLLVVLVFSPFIVIFYVFGRGLSVLSNLGTGQ